MYRWIAPLALLTYLVPAQSQEPIGPYVPPPTFASSLENDQPIMQAMLAFRGPADEAFRSAVEKLATSGDVVAQILLANLYTPPECDSLPLPGASKDCLTSPQAPNPTSVTRSFDKAIYWLTQASDRGNGEATEMLAELTERAIRSSGNSSLKMTDVARLHALARSQGFDLQEVEYSCYTLEPSPAVKSLSMAANTPPEFDISPEQLIRLQAAGITGTLSWQITNHPDLKVSLQHPEGPKVHLRVIVSSLTVHRESKISLPNRADVLYLQQADRVITLPANYPAIARTVVFRPATESQPGAAFYQSIDGSFQEICSSPSSPFPSITSGQNPIEDFFAGLATTLGEERSRRGQAAYGKLTAAIETMTPAQIAAGIAVIDHQLDNPAEPRDRETKDYAENLFTFIGRRSDGPELLASQVNRLASMLNDPSDNSAVTALQTIYRDRPDLLVPIFDAQLRAPEVPHNVGMGVAPSLALLLLYVQSPSDDATNAVARYLHRPELADDELLYVITGVNKLPLIPDALAAELLQSLDRSNEQIKIQALIGLAKADPSFRAAIRTRMEKIANDPKETAHVRQLAAETLSGESPETSKTSVDHSPKP